MRTPFHLGLRYNRHIVSLMKLNGQAREVLGVAYPEDAGRRRRVLAQWGIDAQSPRRPEPATVNLPLPPRDQTILSYQLDPSIREVLNGVPPAPWSRRDNEAGVKERMHLGPHRAVMSIYSRPAERKTAATHSTPTAPVRARHGMPSASGRR